VCCPWQLYGPSVKISATNNALHCATAVETMHRYQYNTKKGDRYEKVHICLHTGTAGKKRAKT